MLQNQDSTEPVKSKNYLERKNEEGGDHSEKKHLKKLREKTSYLFGIDFENNNRIVFYKKINSDKY